MIFKKIYNHFRRKIIRVYEGYRYYDESKNEIRKICSDNRKNTIWFVGSAHYDNIGDLAISSATRAFLEKNFLAGYYLIEIRLCDYYKYEKVMKENIKEKDIIILQGGGNLGFKYFDAEFNRREVITKFPNNKIVVFPCTIDYGNTVREQYELKKSIKLYNGHGNLNIVAREQKSYELLRNLYNKCNIILEPDIVLNFDKELFEIERKDIGICLRNDLEKTNINIDTYELEKNYSLNKTDNISEEKNVSINSRNEIIKNKLKEIASYKAVLTDRLHFMIFCAITSTPCIFVNNTNKKLEGVYNLWLKKYNYIKMYDSKKDITVQVNELLKSEKNFNYSRYKFNKIIDLIRE